MVKVRICSFCGGAFQPGEGITYVKNDGSILQFCNRRCRMNKLVYKKNPRKTKWTKVYGAQ
jgi:large subunit ribosomal protein L24e